MQATTLAADPRRPGRWQLWLGMGLPALGLALVVAQYVGPGWLFTPWYLPVLGTAGLILLIAAFVRSPGAGRAVAVVLFGLLAVLQWYVILAFSRLPAYTGPVAVGRPFPAFTTTLADGGPFTQADLGAENTALVFFRGRW